MRRWRSRSCLHYKSYSIKRPSHKDSGQLLLIFQVDAPEWRHRGRVRAGATTRLGRFCVSSGSCYIRRFAPGWQSRCSHHGLASPWAGAWNSVFVSAVRSGNCRAAGRFPVVFDAWPRQFSARRMALVSATTAFGPGERFEPGDFVALLFFDDSSRLHFFVLSHPADTLRGPSLNASFPRITHGQRRPD